jgi:hypothetical protein
LGEPLKNPFYAFLIILTLLLAKPSVASEAGASHYIPGGMASFIDMPSGIL